MPYHMHPRFRARELVYEAEGLIQTRNTDGFTRILDAESAGTRPAAATVLALARHGFFYIRGTKVDASTL